MSEPGSKSPLDYETNREPARQNTRDWNRWLIVGMYLFALLFALVLFLLANVHGI
jgi:hypothetical protein